MLLKSVKLENIRSYLSQKIEFHEGSTLLSGDIGSGKSTILLAIEFALFGLLRGELAGTTLLRHGKNTGMVELTFELGNKTITIQRHLKRTSTGIEQQAGSIIINGIKKELTAQELKARVLELLGYPKDFLAKSKNLIYKYTVYTPQEEMKRILLEDRETRIDILRRIFGIDKYRRVRENTDICTRMLRERKKELAGKTADLDEKKKQAEQKKAELTQLEAEILALKPRLEAAVSAVAQKKKLLAEAEQQLTEYHELKRKTEVCDAEIKNKTEQLARTKKELETTAIQITELQKQTATQTADPLVIAKNIAEKNQQLLKAETELRTLHCAITEHNLTKKQSEETKQKITALTNCPLCRQNVNDEHKHKIKQDADAKICEAEKQLHLHEQKARETEQKIQALKRELDELRKNELEAKIKTLNITRLKEKQNTQTELLGLADKLTNELNNLEQAKNQLAQQLVLLAPAEETRKKLKAEVDNAIAKEREAEITISRIAERKRSTEETIATLEAEINTKEQALKKLLELQKAHDWLENWFAPMTAVIEKHVMAKIHADFNALFRQWFSALVSDEMLSARLDETFTPIVEQDGYETEFDNLSGGEKTACALAYRLALNRVINDIMATIQTKNLLILDEPTDGFSAEQIQKMHDVFEQLAMKQLIIVSHEPAMEGMVDRTIRITKQGHSSTAYPATNNAATQGI